MDLIILDGAPVKLGTRILCGPRVGIYAATHSSELSLSASDTKVAHWLCGACSVTARLHSSEFILAD